VSKTGPEFLIVIGKNQGCDATIKACRCEEGNDYAQPHTHWCRRNGPVYPHANGNKYCAWHLVKIPDDSTWAHGQLVKRHA